MLRVLKFQHKSAPVLIYVEQIHEALKKLKRASKMLL